MFIKMTNNFNIPISFKINEQLLSQLKKLCNREHISQSQAIRSSLVSFMKLQNIQISNNVFPKDDDGVGNGSW